jgi:hypothetical protein
MAVKFQRKKSIFSLTIAFFAGLNANFAIAQEPGGVQPTQTAVPERTKQLPEAKQLPAEAARRLEALGAKVFGIKWGDKPIAVSARGFQVVTDGVTTLSYRPTGEAYFVQNAKAGLSCNNGFQDSSKQLIARGNAILSGLGIQQSEIAETKVLQQFVSAGFINPSARQARIEEPQKDRQTLLITRAIRSLPIWSSRLLLDLDRAGNIASLELSWPKIQPKVLEAAFNLQRVVNAGYKPPERSGAKVESVQAGILHSGAASFIDDQVAAIRVVYKPTDPRFSMKPLVYLGADSKPVAIPRQMEAKVESPMPARTGKPDESPH